MGTRHLQKVISKNGEVKISQYGQWDGYPDGQGVQILQYLRDGNIDKYSNNLDAISECTDSEISEIDSDPQWKTKYPYLSRDCGSKIHKMIEDGIVKFVVYCSEEEANKWCEGFYTIDPNKNEFTSEFYDSKATFNLSDLPTDEEYICAMNPPECDD